MRPPPLVDTHCHLDASRFGDEQDALLQRAWAAGVCGVVIPGVDPVEWEGLSALQAKDPRVRVAYGVHPQILPDVPESDDDALIERLESHLAKGEAIAVGECGLDGPSQQGAPMERQVRLLRRHFALARKYELPILVHVYKAHPAMQELLKDEPIPERGLLLHSFSGGPDLAKYYADRGCHFSFAGPISWPEARKPLLALKAVPLERLMLETDAPDQAPWPHRGQRSEPAFMPFIAEAAARAFGLDLDTLARTTTETARTFFRYPFGQIGP